MVDKELFGNSEQLDTISRQAALDEKNIVHIEMFGRDFPVVPVATLKKLPSAQSEIIRCGECVHSNKEYSGEMWCGICNGFGIDENSFCSFAERRTDG